MTASTGFPLPEFLTSTSSAYYFILLVFAVCMVVMYLIYRSPFGMTLQGHPGQSGAVLEPSASM